MAAGKTPLPPGDSELPLLGGTLRFLKDGFHFIEERAKKYGPVFQTNLFGKDTAILSGAEGAGAFIDEKNVQRHGSVPPHIAELLFGKVGLPTLDGPEHADRKKLILAAFSREAITVALPKLQRICAAAFARWQQQPEVRLVPELNALALEVICTSIMGIDAPEKLQQLGRDYQTLIAGVTALPIPLPATAFTKARDALGRILETFRGAVRAHRAEPAKFDDGLTRILAARTQSGAGIDDEIAAIELHHLVIAGLVVWAWLAAAVTELNRNQPVRDKLLAEQQGAPAQLTVEAMHGMQSLERFGMEIRRTTPVIHVVFGKAKETFEFAGKQVPAGWMLLWGVNASHKLPGSYTEPEKFDPDRFAPERAEHQKHEHSFAPQGAGAPTFHKCAGWEFAPLLLKVFTVELLKRQITLPQQNLELDWTKIPPEPKDGLRATVKPAL